MTPPAPASLQPPSLAGVDWLVREETQAVFRAIADGGFAARVVGGAVRNALFGRPVKDVDFATTATPQEVLALAARAGLACVPTGIDHGTVTVLVRHVPFEVTTLRRDVETDGRHARVAFTRDWEADARRRDFTFNALYCDAGGEVFDPLGGYPDLIARRVRFIGDPHARIREDFLRILRYFRFHAEYGERDFDAPSLAACIAERDGLTRLSGERIRVELLRLLAADGAVSSVRRMRESGILVLVLGAEAPTSDFEHLVDLECALRRPADAVLRLAALTLTVARPADLQLRLRLSSDETKRIATLGLGIDGLGRDMGEAQAKAAIYRHGTATFLDALLLAWARSRAAPDDGRWLALASLASAWSPPQLPIRGADVVALGLAPGPRVGAVIADLECWWIEQGFPQDNDRIQSRLRQLVESARQSGSR